MVLGILVFLAGSSMSSIVSIMISFFSACAIAGGVISPVTS